MKISSKLSLAVVCVWYCSGVLYAVKQAQGILSQTYDEHILRRKMGIGSGSFVQRSCANGIYKNFRRRTSKHIKRFEPMTPAEVKVQQQKN